MDELVQSRAISWSTNRTKPVRKRVARLLLELNEKKRARKRAGETWSEVISDGA
jgi:hypothetical protein